jgi:hypothetical protein
MKVKKEESTDYADHAEVRKSEESGDDLSEYGLCNL